MKKQVARILTVTVVMTLAAAASCGAQLVSRNDDDGTVAGEERIDPEIMSGRILRCHDGDTCTAILDDERLLTLRLAGVDAPAIGSEAAGPGQPLGAAARAAANSVL